MDSTRMDSDQENSLQTKSTQTLLSMNNNSISKGIIIHARHGNKPHKFTYKHTMLFIELNTIVGYNRIAKLLKYNSSGILSIRDKDHIDSNHQSLYEKVITKMKGSGTNILSTDKIMMLTTPSFMGYAFNPATFFFVCNQDLKIKSAIVEVHNTFGEAHLYILTESSFSYYNNNYIANKKFHVSPFLDRKGHYEFHFHISQSTINISIILNDDKNKLITTTYLGNLIPLSTKALINSLPNILVAVLLTELRILYQAFKLFFSIKAPFFEKPPPIENTTVSPARGFISRIKLPFHK
ncbi:MAG TPA: hypothetical protein DCL76_00925 [Chloroflexi bacterium]|nr:hypothetical protein [Chloroflexota bacterium]